MNNMINDEWGIALSAVADSLMDGFNEYKSSFGMGKKRVKQKPKGYLKKKRAKRRMCKSNRR